MRARHLLVATLLLTVTGSLSTALAEAHHHVAVTIKSYAYTPNPFDVHVGETVVWTNEDSAPHTVTSASGPTKLDSPEFGKGGSWAFTASQPGTYHYYCAVHPDMKASFTVLPVAATPVAAPTHAARAVSRARPAVVVASPTPSPSPVLRAETPARAKTLDPNLLLVAITVGAVAMALLALGRRRQVSPS